MARIKEKKIAYEINGELRSYLRKYGREMELPICYTDLLRYDFEIPLYDRRGDDTFWVSLNYSPSDLEHINYSLKAIYAKLVAGGDESVQQHLKIERIDLCLYGNTKPFRARVVNMINDNFDYFYIKNADASRIYGLELEDILSPESISFVVDKNTIIERHIVGVPGQEFIRRFLVEKDRKVRNEIRLAKEFVKFNERCFVRLLGDMHSSNYVVELLPDFDDVHYRLRAIDFDQQSYEGRKSIYFPQYFKQNQPIIDLGIAHMNRVTMRQYQTEERAMIAYRIKYAGERLPDLLEAMKSSPLSKPENVIRLRKELSKHYKNADFLKCESMGEIVELSLKILLDYL